MLEYLPSIHKGKGGRKEEREMRGKERSEGGDGGKEEGKKNPQTWAMKHYNKITESEDKENCESNETNISCVPGDGPAGRCLFCPSLETSV